MLDRIKIITLSIISGTTFVATIKFTIQAYHYHSLIHYMYAAILATLFIGSGLLLGLIYLVIISRELESLSKVTHCKDDQKCCKK